MDPTPRHYLRVRATGELVLVDPDIYEQFKYTTIGLRKGYPMICLHRKQVSLHRYVMGLPEGVVDHINRNTLDCRRENLRVTDQTGNSRNRGKSEGRSSKYKGVCYFKRNGKWIASITVAKRTIHLGYFEDEARAALAYDEAARQLFGEYACLNFPDVVVLRYSPQYEHSAGTGDQA